MLTGCYIAMNYLAENNNTALILHCSRSDNAHAFFSQGHYSMNTQQIWASGPFASFLKLGLSWAQETGWVQLCRLYEMYNYQVSPIWRHQCCLSSVISRFTVALQLPLIWSVTRPGYVC